MTALQCFCTPLFALHSSPVDRQQGWSTTWATAQWDCKGPVLSLGRDRQRRKPVEFKGVDS